MSTGRIPLFPGHIHERKQFFRLVGREWRDKWKDSSSPDHTLTEKAPDEQDSQVARTTTADAGHDAEEITQNRG